MIYFLILLLASVIAATFLGVFYAAFGNRTYLIGQAF